MKKVIKKVIHAVSGLMTESDFRIRMRQEREVEYERLPRILLEQKHIDKLQVLTDRAALLKCMPVEGVCAEIGVNRGEFSKQILSITRPSEMHLVDAWSSHRYHDGLRIEVEEVFKEEISQKKVFLHHGMSTDKIPEFPDDFFDWVYLDTGHDYQGTKEELNLLKRKIKKGGFIAGHDYLMGNWIYGIRYGVMEAVHEFCKNEDWQFRYLTINQPESPSFVICEI